jgi:hypothetical protein
MDRSVDALEREVEETRARLDRTLGGLQSRLNIPSIAHDLRGTSADPKAIGAAVLRLRSEVRQNPVPALLACVGVSWLVFDTIRRSVAARKPAISADVFPTPDV